MDDTQEMISRDLRDASTIEKKFAGKLPTPKIQLPTRAYVWELDVGGWALSFGLEGQRAAELQHPSVLEQRWLHPQRAVVRVQHGARAAVEHVVDIHVRLQPHAIRDHEALCDTEVQSRQPVIEHRLRSDERHGCR